MFRKVFSNYCTVVSEEPNDSGEMAAVCPLHDDHRPSLSFNVESGLWYCFACGQGGDAVDFIMRSAGASRQEALAEVRETTGLGPPSEEEVQRWAVALPQSATAMGYLAKRGLADPPALQVLQDLQVGWDGDRITVPIRDRNGALTNVRRIAVQRRGNGKVLNLPGCGSPPSLWPLSSLEANTILVCEGEIDTLTALAQGHAAITGTGGASVWLADWDTLFHGKNVLIAYDGDAEGRRGAERAATALRGVAADVRILDVPEGEDVNSLHRQGVSLADIIGQPDRNQYTDIDELVASMPAELQVAEKMAWLERLAAKLAGKPVVVKEHYIELARKALGLPKDRLREAVETAEMRGVAAPIPQALAEPPGMDLCPAQDYRDGVFHYGVWLPTQTGDWVFRLVRSDRELRELPPGTQAPPLLVRWSVDMAAEANVFSFLSGKVPPQDTRQLFEDIRRVFTTFMWYRDEAAYTMLALWVMESYVFMLFDCVPYLALTGTKESGKSRTLELLEELCFNAVTGSSFTASFLFRVIERARQTLLLDEADILSALRQGSVEDERVQILLNGYRRSGKAGRVEGEEHTPRYYSVYSPKAFASMYHLPEALTSRCVVLGCFRKTGNVELSPLLLSDEQQRFQALRNRLYCWGLQSAPELYSLRKQINVSSTGLRDRELEVWQGMLSVALLCGEEVYKEALEYAGISREIKKATEQEVSITTACIRACLELLRDERPDETRLGEKWYVRARVREKVASLLEVDADKITPERIRAELSRTGVLGEGSGWSRQAGAGNLRGKRLYRLDPDKVMEAASRFGLEEADGL